MVFVTTYPFLCMSVILMGVCVVCMMMSPSRRFPMLLSGSLCVPFCLYEVIFMPEYWTPVRMAMGFVGLEDIMFSFSTGSMAWFFATCCLRGRITLSIRPWRFSRRFFGCSILGVGLSLILRSAGFRVMTATLLAVVVGFVALAWRYRRLQWISIPGALGFTLLHVIVFKAVLMVSPHFLLQWNLQELWGVSVLGLPVEEVLWAFCFGAVWPRFMAYVFDASLVGSVAEQCQEEN